MQQMPLYDCHKQVRALEIKDCVPLGDKVKLVFADPHYPPTYVNSNIVARYAPLPGDFYVVYSDGYASISPAKAFKEGYRLAEKPPAVAGVMSAG